MSDIPVYVVASLRVTDADTYHLYEKGFFPLLKKYGGEFITYDDKPDTFEGEQPRQGRMVILQFPSEQNARDWYADADYQQLSKHRRAGTSLDFLTMVRGTPARA